MTVCLRCSKCCYFPDENGRTIRCKHLVKLKSGKSLCRVYNSRLNRLLYKKADYEVRCLMRIHVHKNYDGCPFNEVS